MACGKSELFVRRLEIAFMTYDQDWSVSLLLSQSISNGGATHRGFKHRLVHGLSLSGRKRGLQLPVDLW